MKRRLTDFFGQVENLQADLASAPEHDVSLLFRSVEGKFVGADPSERLQGAWIVTDIKQDANELKTAFDALDPTKVHFAILGDWLPDVTLLTRRQEDRSTLIDMLRLKEGTRFVFERRRPLAPG